MKLAEALILRADCKKLLSQLRERMAYNARVQEGEVPAEDPNALLAEYDRVAGELEKLIRSINRTNLATQVGDVTLTDALAERDVLHLRYTAYRQLVKEASAVVDRYSRTEIPCRSAVDVRAVQADADRIARRYRELDARIQQTNWEAELIG